MRKFIGTKKVICKRLKEGDNNLKFFHKVVCSKKRITHLNVQGVDVVVNVNVIKDEATSFFSKNSKEGMERPIFDNPFAHRLTEDCVFQLES